MRALTSLLAPVSAVLPAILALACSSPAATDDSGAKSVQEAGFDVDIVARDGERPDQGAARNGDASVLVDVSERANVDGGPLADSALVCSSDDGGDSCSDRGGGDEGTGCIADPDCPDGTVCCAVVDCGDAGYGACPIIQGPKCLPRSPSGSNGDNGWCPGGALGSDILVELCDFTSTDRCPFGCKPCFAAPAYAPYLGECCRE